MDGLNSRCLGLKPAQRPNEGQLTDVFPSVDSTSCTQLSSLPHNLDCILHILFLLCGVKYQRLLQGLSDGSRLRGAQARSYFNASAGNKIDAGIELADQVSSKNTGLRIDHVRLPLPSIPCLPFINQLGEILSVMPGISAVTASRLTWLRVVTCDVT